MPDNRIGGAQVANHAMLLSCQNRDRLRPVGYLIALGGLLSTACVASLNQTPTVRTEPLCPFEGTEMILAVQAETPAPDLLQSVAAVIAARVHELGVSPTAVFLNEAGQIQVQLPEETDIEQATQLLNSQGELTFRAQKASADSATLNLLLQEGAAAAVTNDADSETLKANILQLFEAPQIRSGDVNEATVPVSTSSRSPEIWLEFSEAGAQAFADLTRDMAGTGRAIGLFLDDELLSAPTVDVRYAETGILGGQAVISGNFSEIEAETIAAQIRSGAFPAPTAVVSLQTVVLDEACEVISSDRL
ncbi:MAG: hypothetical protein F6K00_09395 [Leptolyngbya sp. SIOISBB]|nr:hypothetical protein [Leptolyngbya sp. SIOISBB]